MSAALWASKLFRSIPSRIQTHNYFHRPDPYSGAVIQLRFMGTLAQTEGFEPPTFAFGEQRSTPELSLHLIELKKVKRIHIYLYGQLLKN